ncbi:hypothetical protein BJV74DRAFT_852108 [Russula compacta]|nr:hypothetical protein BJV74DRAFT_852108 [Russula compacta]
MVIFLSYSKLFMPRSLRVPLVTVCTADGSYASKTWPPAILKIKIEVTSSRICNFTGVTRSSVHPVQRSHDTGQRFRVRCTFCQCINQCTMCIPGKTVEQRRTQCTVPVARLCQW